jgi:hypothetical protein
LSNSVTGSRLYTNNQTVAVSISNPAGAAKWCISETQTSRPANGTATCVGGGGPSSGWYTSMPSTTVLSTSDTLKTVYIWVADSSNNVNANPSSATITLLQTPPAAPTVALADPNTGSASATNQNNVSLTVSNDAAATAWCAITQDSALTAPATPATSNTCWVLTRPTSISLGATGSRSAYVFLRDPAMNISAFGSATITLSTSAPADPVLAISDSTTALTNYAKSSALTIAVTADPTATRWCLSETQTVPPSLGTSTCSGGAGPTNGWFTTRPTTFNLTAGDGNKRVYVWVANVSNNVSADAVSQQIVLDTVAPLGFTVLGATGGGDTTADQYLGTTLVPTMNWTASTGSNSYNVVIKDASGSSIICALQSTAGTAYTFAGCNLVNGTSYKAYVSATDLAQNTTAATNNGFTFTVNLTPPGAFTISGASGSQDTIADQWSGTSLPTISWNASTGVNTYAVQVFANDGITVVCSQQIKASAVLAHDYSTTGCTSLTNDTNYKAQLIAVDVAGNTQTATNSPFIFHTDLSSPTISISANPAAQAIVANASFGFAGADTISGVSAIQCKIDSGSFGACNSTTSQAYSGLADGAHTFIVRASDVVGFTQTANFNWQIDTVNPTAFSVLGATGPTDTVIDAYLHNDSKITANWSASATADSYEVTILNVDNSVACPMAIEPNSSTSHYFSTCNLDTSVDYKIKVSAVRGYGTKYTPATMTIHPYHDSLTGVISTSASTVASGSAVTLTLVVSQNGTQMTTGGLNPSFAIASGGSTGTFSSVTYTGSGTYTATMTGVLIGTAASITASTGTGQAFTTVTPTNVTVVPGLVSAANSTFTASKTLVFADNSDLATLSLTLRDLNGNLITGQSPTAAAAGGVSTGILSAFTEIGGGVYTCTFSGRIAGAATTITATSSAVAVSNTISMTVQAGPPVKLAATGPATSTTHSCSGPYNATLRDYYNNLAQATSNVQINFGGLSAGNFSLANDCSTTDLATTVYLGGSTAQPVYAIARTPIASGAYTFTDNAGSLTPGQVSVTVTGTPAWLGATGSLNWAATSGTTTRSNMDGLQSARGVWVNSSAKLMYVADALNHRIVRYDILNQTMTGWIGRVNSVDGLSGTGCVAVLSGAATPGWCTGGTSQVSAGTNLDGMFNNPIALVGDGTYLYIVDNSNNRIVRVNESTGAFTGWFGRVNGIVGLGGAAGCSSVTTGNSTPGWCTGGTSQASSGTTSWDSAFNSPFAIEYYNDAVNGKLLFISDVNNHRIVRLNVASATLVSFDGWSGRINTVPSGNGVNYAGATACSAMTTGAGTLGWCKGGTSQASPVTATPTLTSYDNMYNTPRGLSAVSGTPNLLYVIDLVNSRLVRLNISTGAFDSWSGRATSEFPASGGTGCASYNTDTNWCTGGVPIYSGYCNPGTCISNTASTTYVRNTVGLHSDGTFLYTSVSGSNDYGIHRVSIASPSTTNLWVGRINGLPTSGAGCSTTPIGFATPNWCGGGNSRQGYNDGQFWSVGDLAIDSANDRIYTTDQTLSKVQMHVASTGAAVGWIGAKATTVPSSWMTTYTAGLIGNVAFLDDYTFGAGNGITGAAGILTLGTDLFVTDTGNYRVKHYNASTGSFLGWYGRTNSLPTGNNDSCTSITAGAITPTWCFGGSSQTIGTQGTGELGTPRGIAGDSNYIYIADSGYHRIVRIVRSTASFAGWLGRTGTTPTGMSGFDATGNTNCPAAGTNVFPAAWCAGGNHATGSGDGALNAPFGVASNTAGTVLYVADTSNHRISSYTSATGAFIGWIGRINSVTGLGGGTGCSAALTGTSTPAWCTAQASSGTAAFSGFNAPRYMAYANGYLFVSDTGNNRIHKFDATTATYNGWIGRVNSVVGLGGGTGCSAVTTGNATPVWCTGGTSQASAAAATTLDNQFSSPNGIWADSNYVYVVDNGNERVTKHNAATGAFIGWKGIAATAPTGGDAGCTATAVGGVTGGWCTGGTSRSGRALGGFQSAWAISGDSNFIYVTDALNNRVVALPK